MEAAVIWSVIVSCVEVARTEPSCPSALIPSVKVRSFLWSSPNNDLVIANANQETTTVMTEVLGDYYSLKGEVIHGAKKGRMIGYPTANIDTGDYLIPKKGVYATMTKVAGKWYQSMSSIGHNPTLNCRVDLSVESNIFDFDQDIYGQTIELKFIKRIRDEEKFNSIDELVTRIKLDKIETVKILQELKK